MGSVKDLVTDDSPAGRLLIPPKLDDFGRGAWRVSGRFSVADMKSLIPPVEIAQKAEALTMMTAAFFESLADTNPEIPTCYLGLVTPDGQVKDLTYFLDRGETTNSIAMRLAHTPESLVRGDLEMYRALLKSRDLRCGVADVESIFRAGLPLGSSTFEKICGAAGLKAEYDAAATYAETVEVLDFVRVIVAREGIESLPSLKNILSKSSLSSVPNPGFMLEDVVYDTTTKFERSGDRPITEEEARSYSGLDEVGYGLWKNTTFPEFANAQIEFCAARGVRNVDGKGESIAYHGIAVVTDFACTIDENRLMLVHEHDGVLLGIPTNKEVQRMVFKSAGIYSARSEAQRRATEAGHSDAWIDVLPTVLKERNIDLRAVAEHSTQLMANAVGPVANRLLGKAAFDEKPIATWVGDFLPYASRFEGKSL